MTLICPDCGEKEQFWKEAYGTTGFVEKHILNKDGEAVDYIDYEDYDSKISDYSETRCWKCDQYAKELELKEYVELIWKHTDKKGEWHKDELPEEERDPKILENAIAKKV